MANRVRARALLAVIAAGTLLGAGFVWGYATLRSRIFPYDEIHWVLGRIRLVEHGGRSPLPNAAWRWVRAPKGASPSDEETEQLRALGYLQGYVKAPDAAGVQLYRPELSFQGLNLYVSGHRPEAFLMDMEGHVLHTWSALFRDLWPDAFDPTVCCSQRFWRRARLLPGGQLLAIYDYQGLVKLDRDSRVIWSRNHPFHHDLSVGPDGRIYVLSTEEKLLPEIHPSRPVLEDQIEVLSPEGETLQRVSILQAFRNSIYSSYLEKISQKDLLADGDIFHTNTVKLLDGSHADRSPVFRAGNVMISMRHLDVIAIVDLDREEVVWALSGMFHQQHEPVLLENGDILLFDNAGNHGMSKVMEFDPFSQEVKWSYDGGPDNGFFSECCGSNQRLPNGNTLITDTTNGRALEVTPPGEIVWEFLNPHRSEEDGDLIAVLLEVQRIAPERVADWLAPTATATTAATAAGP